MNGLRAHPPASRLTRQRVRSAWVFLTPMLVVLALVAGWPLARTIAYGFTDASLIDPAAAQFVGFQRRQGSGLAK